MKPSKEQTDGNSDASDSYYEDYNSAEFAEPQMDDVDVELLERFLKMLDETPHSDSNVNYDDLLLKLDDSAETQNNSSGSMFTLTSDYVLLKVPFFSLYLNGLRPELTVQ